MKKEDVREINSWLKRARWHTYLIDIKREKLLESIEELDEENELVLAVIWQIINKMISYCQQTITRRVEVNVRMKIIRTKKHQIRY